MASATGIPENNPREDEPLLGRPGDVTQTTTGLPYNLVLGTAIVAQAGIWILAALVWAAIFEMEELMFFSAHPLLNSAGILLLTQAILIVQPTSSQKDKINGAYVHSALNFVGVSSLLAGLIIIEINKGDHARFTSVHGILGLVTYILVFMQALAGFAAFWVPTLVFPSVEKAKSTYKYHRWSGYITLLLGLCTIAAATQTTFNKNTIHIRLWAVLVAEVLVVAGVGSRIKKQKMGL